MMLSTASAARNHLKVLMASGKRVRPNRMKPYAPSLLTMPAKNINTGTGADSYRSGSHVWNGTIGILMAKAAANARKAHCSGLKVVMFSHGMTSGARDICPPISWVMSKEPR